nr:MAG TPA: hypothetical protein [Caudoviricetes sp.]
MNPEFQPIKIETELTKELQSQGQAYVEKEMIKIAQKKAACFDALIVYLDDLRRIREQYTAFRMYYFDDYPEGDEEPRVSKDEIILDSMIRIMAASNSALHNQILGRGYRKDNPKFEEEMERIHNELKE